METEMDKIGRLVYRCPICRGWCEVELPARSEDVPRSKVPCAGCMLDFEWQLELIWLMSPEGFLRGYGPPETDNPVTPEG
jgi:hypothetical protein